MHEHPLYVHISLWTKVENSIKKFLKKNKSNNLAHSYIIEKKMDIIFLISFQICTKQWKASFGNIQKAYIINIEFIQSNFPTLKKVETIFGHYYIIQITVQQSRCACFDVWKLLCDDVDQNICFKACKESEIFNSYFLSQL